MRVAIFSDSALPILNGVSVSVDTLIQGLRSRGCSVHLFATGFPGHRDADPNTHRSLSILTPWSKGYPLAVPPFLHLLHRFRQQPFDLIHTHTPFTLGMVGLRWAQSHELPIVSTYHTLYDRYSHYVPLLPRRYVRFKIAKHTNFYYNRVDRVIVPSEAAAKWLRRHAVSTPCTVIPTAVRPPAKLDRQQVRAALRLADGTRLLLYVGRIAKEKNLDMLLHAAHAVFQQDATSVLWLVGDGPYRDACTRISLNLGIGDRVRFIGFVPREQVDQYYAAADLFVFPSVTETQGLVVEEAMSHGLPSVVASGGGASAAVLPGVNGLVVRNDPAEFAAAVLSLLQDDGRRRRMGGNAAEMSRHARDKGMVDAVLAVYEEARRVARYRS
ncbi:MAG: glycosyltransferase [Fimbriimonadales bacterium]|nr:glycosyltransferase [Fimbriimonadales bacterium]